jgi:C-terminal processing protease CtpA/Prc
MSRKSIIALILVVLLTGLATAITLAAKESQETSGGGWLGVYLQDISPDIEEAMDLKSDEGVLVTEVMEDSPAEKAGIESKDVIVGFAGKGEKGTFEKVEDSSQLKKMVRTTSPGDVVKLKISREGKEKVITVTLDQLPESEFYSENLPQLPRMNTKKPDANTYFFKFSSGSRIGVKVQDLTEQLGDYFGATGGEGVLITEVEEDMPAQKAGLKAGDVIVAVDGKKIEDSNELISAISEKEKGDKVNIKVIRNHQPQTFAVEVEEGKGERSFDFSGLDNNMKIFKKNLQAPDMQWREESSSDLKQQLDDLREEMQDLKQQLDDLKEKIR